MNNGTNPKNDTNPKIGLLGGTFDPIHFGHLNLALELKERCHLNEVWFIPAAFSPFRSPSSKEASLHRLRMVELAISDIEDFKLVDYEILREGPSYSIDTIRFLIKKFPKNIFTLILGDDVATSFPLWKEADQIIQLLSLTVGKRREGNVIKKLQSIECDESIKEALMRGFVEIPFMEIEGTTIRYRVQKQLYCNHLLPVKVLDYIYRHQLYFKH